MVMFPKFMKVIVVDPNKCLGCRSCELACAVAHSKAGELLAVVLAGERPRKRIYVESAKDKAVPLVCRHCEKAPCLIVCPTGAISRKESEGLVYIDPSLCIGCHSCYLVCPFGMIEFVPELGVAIKCDLCESRTMPACVEACPTGALSFEEAERFVKGKRQEAAHEFLEAVSSN